MTPAWTSAGSVGFLYKTEDLGVAQDHINLYVIEFCCGMWRVPTHNKGLRAWACPECNTKLKTQPAKSKSAVFNSINLTEARVYPTSCEERIEDWIATWFSTSTMNVEVDIDFKD